MEGQIVEKNGKKYIIEKIWKPWESNASGNIIMGHEEHILVPLKNSNSNIKKDLEKKTKAQIISFYKEQGGEEDLSSLHKSDLIKIVVKHVKQILGENNNNNNNNNGYQNYINELTRGGKKRSRKYKTRKQKYRK